MNPEEDRIDIDRLVIDVPGLTDLEARRLGREVESELSIVLNRSDWGARAEPVAVHRVSAEPLPWQGPLTSPGLARGLAMRIERSIRGKR